MRSCYDEGKRVVEILFFDYHRQHNVYIEVMRIFNTYGPRMGTNERRVVSNFIVQAMRGKVNQFFHQFGKHFFQTSEKTPYCAAVNSAYRVQLCVAYTTMVHRHVLSAMWMI